MITREQSFIICKTNKGETFSKTWIYILGICFRAAQVHKTVTDLTTQNWIRRQRGDRPLQQRNLPLMKKKTKKMTETSWEKKQRSAQGSQTKKNQLGSIISDR